MPISRDRTSSPGRTEQGLALALFLLTVALFWPATGCDYMNLDD